MSIFHKAYPSRYKAEVERLTEALIQIGEKEDFLSERPGGIFDQNAGIFRRVRLGIGYLKSAGLN
jgi:hypothetical protein